MVTVQVIKAFEYEGAVRTPGRPVVMSPVMAAVHSYRGDVSLLEAVHAGVADQPSASIIDELHEHNNRDLYEAIAEPPVREPAPIAAKARRTRASKRTYRRRDMRAEP